MAYIEKSKEICNFHLSNLRKSAFESAANCAMESVSPRTAATGDYYMLKCTDYTSVIAECGFLSNAADEALLVTESFRERVAESIYAGIAEYLAAVSGA